MQNAGLFFVKTAQMRMVVRRFHDHKRYFSNFELIAEMASNIGTFWLHLLKIPVTDLCAKKSKKKEEWMVSRLKDKYALEGLKKLNHTFC